MKEFKVEITETLQAHVTIQAKDRYEALEKVKEMYSNQEIVLDYSDFLDNEFEVIDEKETN